MIDGNIHLNFCRQEISMKFLRGYRSTTWIERVNLTLAGLIIMIWSEVLSLRNNGTLKILIGVVVTFAVLNYSFYTSSDDALSWKNAVTVDFPEVEYNYNYTKPKPSPYPPTDSLVRLLDGWSSHIHFWDSKSHLDLTHPATWSRLKRPEIRLKRTSTNT